MNTTAYTNSESSSQSRSNVFKIAPITSNSTEAKQEIAESWINRRIANTTGEKSSGFETFTFTKRTPVIPTVVPQQQVAGNVIKFDGISVECEVSSGGEKAVISLPRTLFAFPVEYGTPFFLGLIEENGIRRPKVSKRSPDKTKYEQLRKQAEEMVNSL